VLIGSGDVAAIVTGRLITKKAGAMQNQ